MAEGQQKKESGGPGPREMFAAAAVLFAGAAAYVAVRVVAEAFDEAFGDGLRDLDLSGG
jgi:hypothetical protein